MIPPNPAELDTSNAAALAAEAERVFEYLAELAIAVFALAEGRAFDAARRAEVAPEGEDRDRAEGYARQAAEHADDALNAARRANVAAERAARFGALGHAAEDVEPAALAEVAEAIARALAVGLESIAETGEA